MKIHLDNEVCSGHGRCYTLAPDVFDADDEGYGADEAIARCLADRDFPNERLSCSSDGAGCLPVFDAARNFTGYRGFGVCRDVARINALTQVRRATTGSRGSSSPEPKRELYSST